MKRILSTALAMALLLGLGALAVLARPGGAALLSPVRTAAALAAPVAQGEAVDAAAPDAPAVTSGAGWNVIATPLHVTGVDLADNVAYYISSGSPSNSSNNKISQVAHWVNGQWVYRKVGGGFGAGTNFAVNVGDALLISAAADAPTSFAWVGDVPQQGSIHYSLPQGGWHVLMLPLDRNVDADNNGTPTADELGNNIGGVLQVAQWVSGQWVYRKVGGGFGAGTNFTVKIGYPYLIETSASTPGSWPP